MDLKTYPKQKAWEDPGVPKREERLEGEAWNEVSIHHESDCSGGQGQPWSEAIACAQPGGGDPKLLLPGHQLDSGIGRCKKDRKKPGRGVISSGILAGKVWSGIKDWVNCLASTQPPAVQDSPVVLDYSWHCFSLFLVLSFIQQLFIGQQNTWQTEVGS